MAQPGATSIGWNPLTQPHARPEKSLEFCEILYAIGRRSPESRSQGLRPPWGDTLHHGEAVQPGGAEAPAEAQLRSAAHTQGGRRRRAGDLGRKTGGIAGKARAHRGKKPGFRGRSGRVCRETAHSGRVSGGSRGAVPGGNRESRGATAWIRRLPAGFCLEDSGAVGQKRRVFGAVGGERGQKSPPRGVLRAENGAGHGVFQTACDGFTLYADHAACQRAFRAYIGRNRRRKGDIYPAIAHFIA